MVLQLFALGVLQKLLYSRLPKGQVSWSIQKLGCITIPYSPTFMLLLASLIMTTSIKNLLAIFIILEIYQPNTKDIVITYRDQKTDVNRFIYFSIVVCLYAYLTPTFWEIFVVLLLGSDLLKSEWLKKITPLK